MEPTKQPVERRPTIVTAAYWLWFVGAVLCLLMGLGYLLVSEDAVLSANPDIADPAALVNLLRLYGGIALVSGIFVGVLSGFVRKGDPRFRRSLVVFSVILAFFQAATYAVSGFYAIGIVVCVLLASILVYRPAAKPWFER